MKLAYLPSAGLPGKVRRLAARTLARKPLQIRLDRPVVTFTFDDFPASAATTGAAILERHGWRGTYYAAAGYAGGENHLGKMFETRDLLRLQKAGHEIGCHTYGHGDASRLEPQAVVKDCERNRNCLSIMGNEQSLDTFAFPYGEASPAIKTALSSRYRALRSVHQGINRGAADRAFLRAIPLDGGAAGLERALRAARDVASRPGWLIYYGHDVRENPSEWGCTPEFLDSVCAVVETAGCEVLTMTAALDRIEGRGERLSA